jgi:hypothetical protein
MADNTIQLKRSSVAGKTPNTSTLSTGELAINLTDKKLYSSDGSNIFEPAGNVSNINITGNATIKAVIANGGIGSAGQVLTSGGTGANAYWSTVSGGGGNSYTFSNGVADNSGTVSVVANTGIIANTSGVFVDSAYIGTLSANNTTYVNGKTESNLNVNNALTANASTYLNGKTESNLNVNNSVTSNTANTATYIIANTGLVSNSSGVFVNSAYIGTLEANTSNTANNASYLGGIAAASYVNSSQLSTNLANYAALAGATFTGDVIVNANLIVSGTTVTVNTATLDVKDTNIIVAKGVASAALANGAGLTVDTANIGWYYHNASNTWQSNVGITPASNATYNLGSATLHWANVYAKAIYANGSVGTAGQVLASNGTAIYWTADQGSNAITSNTLTSNYISVSTGTLTVGNSTVNTDIGNNYVSVGNSSGYVNVYSSYIYLGNSSANATINSTTYTGSANNASYLNGVAAANYVNTSGNYTLSGNVTFSSNLILAATSDLIINAAAGVWANGSFGPNNSILTSNGSAVYWSNGLTSSSLTANSVAITTGTITVGNSTVNTDIGNNYISVGNSTSYVNIYSTYIYFGNSSANAIINSTVYTGTSNNSNYLGGVATANYVNTSGSYTITGVHTYNANIVIGSTADIVLDAAAGISANGTFGTSGQVLTTNGTSTYWSTISGGSVNVAAQYAWTNTQTFSNNITFNANIVIGSTGDLVINAAAGISANGTLGTSGQVLTTNGTAVYWSTASAGVNLASSYAFTNTTASGNATSGAITTAGGLGVANNIYAGGRIGFSNSTNISVGYFQYNATTGSIDMVFG